MSDDDHMPPWARMMQAMADRAEQDQRDRAVTAEQGGKS